MMPRGRTEVAPHPPETLTVGDDYLVGILSHSYPVFPVYLSELQFGFGLVTILIILFCEEEFGSESKRLKGIGIGAPEGPISLDDFRSLQRSNMV